MVLSKDRVGQGLGALCGSILQPSFAILQPKVWCLVLWAGAVRVYLTSKLWLGAWLGAKRKDKKQGVRSKDNKLNLDIPYNSKPYCFIFLLGL